MYNNQGGSETKKGSTEKLTSSKRRKLQLFRPNRQPILSTHRQAHLRHRLSPRNETRPRLREVSSQSRAPSHHRRPNQKYKWPKPSTRKGYQGVSLQTQLCPRQITGNGFKNTNTISSLLRLCRQEQNRQSQSNLRSTNSQPDPWTRSPTPGQTKVRRGNTRPRLQEHARQKERDPITPLRRTFSAVL